MMMTPLFAVLLLVLVAVSSAQTVGFPTTIDMIADVELDSTFLEIGYAELNLHSWTNITTTVLNFNEHNNKTMSAFFSLPEYGNQSFQASYPMVPKMNGRPQRNSDGSYSFEGRLVLPDDTECSNEWFIPVDPGEISVSWMIVEQGFYNLSNNFFLIQEGNITRNSTSRLKDDRPNNFPHHTVVFNYTKGCNELDKSEGCTFPEHPDDGSLDSEVVYKPYITMASLQQLQTSYRKANDTHLMGQVRDINGTLPSPKELFVSVRGRTIYNNRAQYLIATHAVQFGGLFPDYETFEEPELLAFFVYQKGVRIRCTEGLVIETDIYYDITSEYKLVKYSTTFEQIPGLFAMLGTLNSAGDSTILRSFNRTTISSSFITQEDQCVDYEQKHVANEHAFTFVVGTTESEVANEENVVNCKAVYKDYEPSGAPSSEPSSSPSGVPSAQPSGAPSGQPSSSPTGQPSARPSGAPSGKPSSSPTGQPSGKPTGEPTICPSGGPSSRPTRAPTPSPTVSPTANPTALPTVRPTFAPSVPYGNCTFNFVIFDLFGDGFYTTYVNFTTTQHRHENSSSYFHQPNCTAKVVSIYSETCSIDVSMLTFDGSDHLLPWESYWALDFDGETYIGGVDSLLSINYGKVVFSEALIDYSVPGRGVNKCHECPHPPPHNANIPPGQCESTAAAKPCPPPVPKAKPEGKGKGAMGSDNGGKGGGKGKGKGATGYDGGGKGGTDNGLGDKDDDTSNKDVLTSTQLLSSHLMGKDDDLMGVNSTDTDDDSHGKDDDMTRTNETHADDDRHDNDDDESRNSTNTDDDRHDNDDDAGKNSTNTDDDRHVNDDDEGKNSTNTDDDRRGKDDDEGKNSTNADDDHINYGHHKPKPKPKPPYLVYINMYDEMRNGYLDKSGDWSDVFNTAELVGTGGEYSEIKAPILIPNIMTYPKYYLMTKDRKKLIKPPKSICNQNRGIEFCQEALPWQGHFIFRFAGIEPSDPADKATWSFCGVSGGINEEFEFVMRDGVCYPLTNVITADMYCEYGFETAISMSGSFSVTGAFSVLDQLSELDTSVLEKEVSLLLPGDLKVVIDSITHESSDTFMIYFKANLVAESVGYDGSQVDSVETMMQEIESTLSDSFENGLFMNKVIHDLDAIPGTQADVLRLTDSIHLAGNLEIDKLTFQDRHSGVTTHSGEIGGSWSSEDDIAAVSSPSPSVTNDMLSVISLGVVFACVMISVLVVTVLKLPSFGEYSDEVMVGASEHPLVSDERTQDCARSDSERPVDDVVIDSSSRPLVDFSLSSIEEGHKTVQYVDDVEWTLRSRSQQQFDDEASKRTFI